MNRRFAGPFVGTAALMAPAIPRHVWDPMQHDSRWHDSYAERIAQRRSWPIKKYSIGLEPQTPEDWLTYSKRNLAYKYNGALRAAASFPDMIAYYQEMITRGVKMDVDTMFIMISRAARFDKISIPDVFAMYEEMKALGAKPDLAVAEVLHTLWDHSSACDPVWRELQRERLGELYNTLCLEDVRRLGADRLFNLLRVQFARYNSNVKQLQLRLAPQTWKEYLNKLETFEDVAAALGTYLGDFVPPAQKNTVTHATLSALNLSVPDLSTLLGDRADLSVNRFSDDLAINTVLQAAVDRLIDFPTLGSSLPGSQVTRRLVSQRGMVLGLATVSWKAGVLLSTELLAALMDLVKFSTGSGASLEQQDGDAQRLLRYAVRVTGSQASMPYRDAWTAAGLGGVDGRVIGRYLAARDPWSPFHFSFEMAAAGDKFLGSFQAPDVIRATSAAAGSPPTPADAAPASGTPAAPVAPESSGSPPASSAITVLRTPLDVQQRWDDIQRLLTTTAVLSKEFCQPCLKDANPPPMEVFSGMAVFLRRMLRQESRNFDVHAAVFQKVKELKRQCDTLTAEWPQFQPEVEYMESLLAVLKLSMDFCAGTDLPRRQAGVAQSLFGELSQLRHQLLQECRERYDGRFAILWLNEA